MTISRVFVASLLAASALGFAAPAQAQRIDRIVAFGDSLADQGNAIQLLLASPAVPPATKAQLQALYPTGRFSGGANYIDYLSQILDAPVLNYAVGGAQTGPFNQFAGLPGFAQETAIFLSGATPPGTIFPTNTGFEEGDLLALSIGVNDGRAFYTANPGATTAQAEAAALTSVANATSNLNLLVGAGAPTISYVALNAGLTPDILANPTAQALGNAFSTSFNNAFQTTLAGYAASGVMVHYLDGATVLANVAANPSAYGISNLYCPGAPDPTCLINAAGYLFYADGIHPSSDGMRILAQYVAVQLEGPLVLQGASDLSLDVAHQFGRTLTSRMDLGSPRDGDTLDGLRFFITGDGYSRKLGAGPLNEAYRSRGVGVTAGAEAGLGTGVAGIAVNYSRPKLNFGNDNAENEARSIQFGGYAAFALGGAFAQGYAGYGWNKHDIDRAGVVEDMEAHPKGHHFIAGAKGGYLMPLGSFRVGPVVALDYAKAKVNGYTEDGDQALTLNVDSLSYRSMRGSAGIELRGDFGGGGIQLRPYASAMVEKDFTGDERTIHFAQTSAPMIVNSFDLEDASKKAYARIGGGFSAAIFTNVSLDVGGSATIGKNQGEETSAQVGFRVGF
jgi:phospholipase/lecithinase/hemolysin/uncharacterized protein YhjY with autotransporter beta-barrel domain